MRIPIEIKVPKAHLEFTTWEPDHHSLLSVPSRPGFVLSFSLPPLGVLPYRHISHSHYFCWALYHGYYQMASSAPQVCSGMYQLSFHLVGWFWREQEVHYINYHSNKVYLSVCQSLPLPSFLLFFSFFHNVGGRGQALHMLSKCFSTELPSQRPQPCLVAFLHVIGIATVVLSTSSFSKWHCAIQREPWVYSPFVVHSVKLCPDFFFQSW